MAMGAGTACHRIISVSTTTEPADRRFEVFCEAICDVYCGIETHQPMNAVFDASFAAYRLGDAFAAVMAAPGHSAARSRSLLRRRPDDSLFLNFSPSIGYRARIGDTDIAVRPGTPLLLDNRRPFEVDFTGVARMRLFSLRLPAASSAFAGKADGMDRMNAAIRSSLAGRQLSLQMRLLCDAVDAGDAELVYLMSRPVRHLLARLSRELDRRDDPALDDLPVQALKALARGHLASATFDIDQLAGMAGCSVRTVQSRFSEAGETFSAWLICERLSLARDLLQQPAYARRSIEAVAHACGFRDVSHFHRAFKRQYGMPPAAWRRG